MFKIGEFSKLTQASTRMLRYYDETGLLKPCVIDKFTNYRLYSAEQIFALNKILFLRDSGFNVLEIALILADWNNEMLVEQLDIKRLEIEDLIKTAQQKLSKIEQAKTDIALDKMKVHYNVSIKDVPAYIVLSLRRIVPSYYSEKDLWHELVEFISHQNVPLSSNSFTIYHDTDHKETNIDIEVCTVVPELSENIGDFTYRQIERVPMMATTMVYGDYKNIAGAYWPFADWLEEHRLYKMTGQSRQVAHRGAWNEQNPENYLTEIQIPLEIRE